MLERGTLLFFELNYLSNFFIVHTLSFVFRATYFFYNTHIPAHSTPSRNPPPLSSSLLSLSFSVALLLLILRSTVIVTWHGEWGAEPSAINDIESQEAVVDRI